MTQKVKLIPNVAVADLFGYTVAISGDIAVVGARQDDESGNNAGAVYVYERSGESWVQTAKLTASDGAADAQFGFSVAIKQSTIVVGAPFAAGQTRSSGAAYVFARLDGTWRQTMKLVATDGAPGDQFGHAVALANNTIVIGAFFDDDGGNNAGSAYLFERAGTPGIAWWQVAKLTADDQAAGDLFGSSVAIDDGTIIIGAFSDDEKGSNAGAAYLFQQRGSSEGRNQGWQQIVKLTAADAAVGDQFGYAVAIRNRIVVVGAFGAGGQGNNSGAAYLFQPADNSWQQTARLTANDGTAGDQFGAAVTMSDSMIAIGAFGADGPETDPNLESSGSVYLFETNSDAIDVWTQTATLTAMDAARSDVFGAAIALDSATLIVGAYGVDDGATDAGAVYIYGPADQGQPNVNDDPTVYLPLVMH